MMLLLFNFSDNPEFNLRIASPAFCENVRVNALQDNSIQNKI